VLPMASYRLALRRLRSLQHPAAEFRKFHY
jgi:hypothetical protein